MGNTKFDPSKRDFLKGLLAAGTCATVNPSKAAAAWLDGDPQQGRHSTPGFPKAGDPSGDLTQDLTLDRLSPAIKHRVARIWGAYLEVLYRDNTLDEDLQQGRKVLEGIGQNTEDRRKTNAERQSRNKAPAYSAIEEFADILGRRVDSQWSEALLGALEGFAGRKRYQAQRNDDIANSVERDKADAYSYGESRVNKGIIDNNTPDERRQRQEEAESKAENALEDLIKGIVQARTGDRKTLSPERQEFLQQRDDNLLRNLIIPQMKEDVERLFKHRLSKGISLNETGQGFSMGM